jgi:hypothetical protein
VKGFFVQALYHMHPTQVSGDILRPFDILQQPYPNIYEREMVKYQNHPGRVNPHNG